MSDTITALGVDPSSTATGIAIMRGEAGTRHGHDLLDCWLVRPTGEKTRQKADAKRSGPRLFRDQLLHHDALSRMLECVPEVLETVRDQANRIDVVGVETCSGKVGTGSRKGASSSLGVYGMAAGGTWLVMACLGVGRPVIPVDERQHTVGTGGKPRRRAALEYACPNYDAKRDPGGDVADGASVASWVISQWGRVQEAAE